jgi:hypothetical protein
LVPVSTPLDYSTVHSGQRAAARVRGVVLALGIVLGILGVVFTVSPGLYNRLGWYEFFGIWGTPFAPINSVSDRPVWYAMSEPDFDLRYWSLCSVFLGALLVAQWVLLSPAGSWRPKVVADAKPARSAAAAGAFVAMLLTIGLLATLLEAGGHWQRLNSHDVIRGSGFPEIIQDFRALWPVMAVVWAFWTALIAKHFLTHDHRSGVAKLTRWLFAGSLLNILAAAPVQATKTGDCYCAKGSYTGLVFGLTIAVWLFGPAVFLLYFRELRRVP